FTYTGATGSGVKGDRITIESVAAHAFVEINGSSGDDVVRVVLPGLDLTATTKLHGLDPSTRTATDPGDTLIFDPTDPAITDINFQGDLEAGGSAQLKNFGAQHKDYGVLQFDTFETDAILAGPSISFDKATYLVDEGKDLTLTVTVVANGVQ